jgi:membrane protein YdbS with pleckstrin-like domain
VESVPRLDPDLASTPERDRPAPAWSDWQRLPPAAALVKTIAGLTGGFVLGMPSALLLTRPLPSPGIRIAAGVAVVIVATAVGAWVGRQRWRRTFWKLDERGLHVRRGWLLRSEVLVPRSRVQHLDLERGPLERQFGLATLVVHTAGSQTQALRQSGLLDADAVAVRDALIPEADRDGDAL